MSIPRLYVEETLAEGVPVQATPAQAHHLGGVLRRGPGDAVHLFNGTEGEWLARVQDLRKGRCTLLPERLLRAPAAEPELRLLVAALKRDAMDWVVEKATELGATLVQPVLTRRSVVDRANTERLSAIARGAAEQCERLAVPRIAEARPLHAVLDAWDGARLLVGAERGAAPSIAAVATGARAWLVGPEGGFDRAELDDLARRPFVALAALGPRILRAETAAIAGLAVMQALAGDWAQRRD